MAVPRNILVVEDEPLIAMMLEDFLETLGHSVHASCDSVKDAVDHADKGGFDVAILDVNLNGESVWPVAHKLREKKIPFVIATGGHVEPPPTEFKDVPLIEKPYTVDRVTPALDAALAG
jgi:DNA-binding response OmpR family regulator